MTLDELKKLEAAATGKEPGVLVSDAVLGAACREMVPRLIAVAEAADRYSDMADVYLPHGDNCLSRNGDVCTCGKAELLEALAALTSALGGERE